MLRRVALTALAFAAVAVAYMFAKKLLHRGDGSIDVEFLVLMTLMGAFSGWRTARKSKA